MPRLLTDIEIFMEVFPEEAGDVNYRMI